MRSFRLPWSASQLSALLRVSSWLRYSASRFVLLYTSPKLVEKMVIGKASTMMPETAASEATSLPRSVCGVSSP